MREIDTNFEEPRDMRNAKDRLVILRADIEDISEQLEAAEKPYSSMSDHEYEKWQRKARAAKKWKEVETRWIRNWMEVHNFTHLKSEDMAAGGLLLASLPILNTAAEEGLVDDGNQVIVEAVRGYVKNRFPAVGGLITGTVALETMEEANAA